MEMDKHILLERALSREREARTKAEELLESKSRELYSARQELEKQYDDTKRAKLELEFLYELTLFVLVTHDFKEIMQFFIDHVCQMTGWKIAHVYAPAEDEPTQLKSMKIWRLDDRFDLNSFVAVSEGTSFKKGVGLPGRVFDSGKSLWLEDITQDNNFPRAKMVSQCHVKSAFAVPIKVFSEIVAVPEFFASDLIKKDERMLKHVETAAIQLGMAIERQRSDQQLKENNIALKMTLEDLQNAQTQLVQSEKMAGLGLLAAGVAHEINNPVGFVMSNLGTLRSYVTLFKDLIANYDDYLKQAGVCLEHANSTELNKIRDLKASEDYSFVCDDVDQLIKESIEGTERVREIVQGLKSFARVDEADLKEADLLEGLESTIKIVWNELKYKCDLKKNFQPLPRIRCYPGQLNQVFMNILVNAAQAIENHGIVSIETAVEDEWLVIKISDTGHGIKQEDKDKLFTPFFTTKPVGHGTGLGLSVSYGIIKKHGGIIEVESELDKGTTFVIKLPKSGVTHV